MLHRTKDFHGHQSVQQTLVISWSGEQTCHWRRRPHLADPDTARLDLDRGRIAGHVPGVGHVLRPADQHADPGLGARRRAGSADVAAQLDEHRGGGGAVDGGLARRQRRPTAGPRVGQPGARGRRPGQRRRGRARPVHRWARRLGGGVGRHPGIEWRDHRPRQSHPRGAGQGHRRLGCGTGRRGGPGSPPLGRTRRGGPVADVLRRHGSARAAGRVARTDPRRGVAGRDPSSDRPPGRGDAERGRGADPGRPDRGTRRRHPGRAGGRGPLPHTSGRFRGHGAPPIGADGRPAALPGPRVHGCHRRSLRGGPGRGRHPVVRVHLLHRRPGHERAARGGAAAGVVRDGNHRFASWRVASLPVSEVRG